MIAVRSKYERCRVAVGSQFSRIQTIYFTFCPRPYCDLIKVELGRVVVRSWSVVNVPLGYSAGMMFDAFGRMTSKSNVLAFDKQRCAYDDRSLSGSKLFACSNFVMTGGIMVTALNTLWISTP